MYTLTPLHHSTY